MIFIEKAQSIMLEVVSNLLSSIEITMATESQPTTKHWRTGVWNELRLRRGDGDRARKVAKVISKSTWQLHQFLFVRPAKPIWSLAPV